MAINALDFGADKTGVVDSGSAIQTAIAALGTVGGLVMLPSGSYKICSTINIPASCGIIGEGSRATVIDNCTDDGYAFLLGGSSGSLNYGCSLRSLAIMLQTQHNHAIQIKECAGASASDIYLEGFCGSLTTRTNTGVFINGGNSSTFFNDVRNVICNHMHAGYKFGGTVAATNTCFTNCSAFGDRAAGDTTSVGFLNDTGHGNGSTFTGGNFEDCNLGVELGHLSLPMSFFGTRFEGNAYDIYNSSSHPTLFCGCVNIGVVYNDSGQAVNPVILSNCTNASYGRWP